MFANNKWQLRGVMDSSFNMQGHVVGMNLLPGWSVLLQPVLTGKTESDHLMLETDFKGSGFNVGTRLIPSGGAVEWSNFYTQSITRSLSAGAQLLTGAVHMDPGMLVGKPSGAKKWLGFGQMSVTGKYSTKECAATANLGWPCTPGSSFLVGAPKFKAGYVQKLKDNVQLGTDLNVGIDQRGYPAVKSKIGYKMDFVQSGYVINGSVDSDGLVKSVIEAKLVPGNLTMTMSAELNHGSAKASPQAMMGGKRKLKPNARFGLSLQLQY